ncbi:hypothetical protein ACKKBG_A21130 [Auxenochlorella protothecoides x Auxenochlorella symbiontica]
MTEMEIRVLTSPGDGVGPAILLDLPHLRPSVQYMFGAPEGISRLALEQRQRPGLGLRAVFGYQARGLQTGLAGLLMRLRGDGVGQVHVTGPAGTVRDVAALQHFVQWKTPHVLASDCYPDGDSIVFEDDLVAVAMLWPGPRESWHPPHWLNRRASPPSDPSSSDETGSSDEPSSSDSESGSEQGSGSGTSSEGHSPDDASSSSSSSSNGSSSEAGTSASASSGSSSSWKGGPSDTRPAGQAGSPRPPTCPPPVQPGRSSPAEGQFTPGTQGPRHPPASLLHSVPRKRARGAGAPGPARCEEETGTVSLTYLGRPQVVSAGRAYVQTPADRISLYVAIEDVIGLGRKAPPPPVAPSPPSPLALLTWVKSLDRLVLIARLANRVELEALQAHPAMPGLLGLANGARLAACSVVLGEGLPASDPGLVDLAAALPCPMLLLPEPQEGLQAGNTAAARVSARLNLAAPAFFPLPHGLAVDGTVEACSTPGLCTGEPLTVTSSLALEFRAGEVRTPSLTRLGVGHATPGEARAAALEAHPAAAGMLGVLHQAQPEVQAQGYDIPRSALAVPPPPGGLVPGKSLVESPAARVFAAPRQGAMLESPPARQPPTLPPAANWSAAAALRARLLGKSLQHAEPAVEGGMGSALPSTPGCRRGIASTHAAASGRLASDQHSGAATGVGAPTPAPHPPVDPTTDPSLTKPPTPRGSLEENVQRRPHPQGALPATPPRAGQASTGSTPPAQPPPPPGHPPAKADLPSLHFLGTGSAEPSKYRSASAIWLSLDPSSSILLDCGEGTAGQLTRTLGAVAARTLLATLRVLWVSHRHADHMGGVPGVLRAVPEGTPRPLVVGPRSLRDWLAACGGEDLRYEFLHAGCLRRPGHPAAARLAAALSGAARLAACPARHCSDAWSLRIDAARSWSIVYSGDTTPNPDLRALCSPPPTLLVHEATFGEGREGEAERKRHSTTAQALELAQIARPWATILTHFSQRYPGYPEGVPLDGNSPAVAAAFDGMVVSLRLLHALAATQPVVAVLLDRDEDEVADVEGGQEP